MLYRKTIALEPNKEIFAHNLTQDISCFVREYRILNGLITVQSMHTTGGVIINEYEQGLLTRDLETIAESLAPKSVSYAHDDLSIRKDPQPDERENGWAHLRAMILTLPQVHLYVDKGELILGRYQSVIYIDFDGERRKRNIELLCHNPRLQKTFSTWKAPTTGAASSSRNSYK